MPTTRGSASTCSTATSSCSGRSSASRRRTRGSPLGRGICGAAAAEKATIIVDDVNADPRYLACSIDTKSEIVVPIMHGGDVLGEIDIDSDRPAAFGPADRELLEAVAALLAPKPAPPDDTSTMSWPRHYAHSRRRHRSGGHRGGRPDLQGRRPRHRVGPHDAGVIAFKRFNQSLPAELLDSIRRNKVALKGPVTTPIGEGFTSVNVGLRKALDLYANLRPVRNLPGVASRFRTSIS